MLVHAPTPRYHVQPQNQLGLFTVLISAGLLALLSLPYSHSTYSRVTIQKWQALVLGWKEPEFSMCRALGSTYHPETNSKQIEDETHLEP